MTTQRPDDCSSAVRRPAGARIEEFKHRRLPREGKRGGPCGRAPRPTSRDRSTTRSGRPQVRRDLLRSPPPLTVVLPLLPNRRIQNRRPPRERKRGGPCGRAPRPTSRGRATTRCGRPQVRRDLLRSPLPLTVVLPLLPNRRIQNRRLPREGKRGGPCGRAPRPSARARAEPSRRPSTSPPRPPALSTAGRSGSSSPPESKNSRPPPSSRGQTRTTLWRDGPRGPAGMVAGFRAGTGAC